MIGVAVIVMSAHEADAIAALLHIENKDRFRAQYFSYIFTRHFIIASIFLIYRVKLLIECTVLHFAFDFIIAGRCIIASRLSALSTASFRIKSFHGLDAQSHYSATVFGHAQLPHAFILLTIPHASISVSLYFYQFPARLTPSAMIYRL